MSWVEKARRLQEEWDQHLHNSLPKLIAVVEAAEAHWGQDNFSTRIKLGEALKDLDAEADS